MGGVPGGGGGYVWQNQLAQDAFALMGFQKKGCEPTKAVLFGGFPASLELRPFSLLSVVYPKSTSRFYRGWIWGHSGSPKTVASPWGMPISCTSEVGPWQ